MTIALWVLVGLCTMLLGLDREWSHRAKGVVGSLVLPAFTGLVLVRGTYTNSVPGLETTLFGAYLGWLVGSGFRPAAAFHEMVDPHANFGTWRIVGGRVGLVVGGLLGMLLGPIQ